MTVDMTKHGPEQVQALRDEIDRLRGLNTTQMERLDLMIQQKAEDEAALSRIGQEATTLLMERDGLNEQVRILADQKAADHERIAALIREKTDAEAELQDARRATQQAQIRHDNDVATIGEALLEEAERRDWCSEFDEFVADINEKLHVPLPRRIKDWDVYVPVEVTVRVSVSAISEEDARAEAGNEWRDRWDGEYAAEIISEGRTMHDGDFKVEEID